VTQALRVCRVLQALYLPSQKNPLPLRRSPRPVARCARVQRLQAFSHILTFLSRRWAFMRAMPVSKTAGRPPVFGEPAPASIPLSFVFKPQGRGYMAFPSTSPTPRRSRACHPLRPSSPQSPFALIIPYVSAAFRRSATRVCARRRPCRRSEHSRLQPEEQRRVCAFWSFTFPSCTFFIRILYDDFQKLVLLVLEEVLRLRYDDCLLRGGADFFRKLARRSVLPRPSRLKSFSLRP